MGEADSLEKRVSVAASYSSGLEFGLDSLLSVTKVSNPSRLGRARVSFRRERACKTRGQSASRGCGRLQRVPSGPAQGTSAPEQLCDFVVLYGQGDGLRERKVWHT